LSVANHLWFCPDPGVIFTAPFALKRSKTKLFGFWVVNVTPWLREAVARVTKVVAPIGVL